MFLPVTKLILLHRVVVLHSTHHIQMTLVMGWGTMSKCSKTIYYKNLLGTNFIQTCRYNGIYQDFSYVCVPSNSLSIVLSLNQNICCGYPKEPSQRGGSFEHQIIGEI